MAGRAWSSSVWGGVWHGRWHSDDAWRNRWQDRDRGDEWRGRWQDLGSGDAWRGRWQDRGSGDEGRSRWQDRGSDHSGRLSRSRDSRRQDETGASSSSGRPMLERHRAIQCTVPLATEAPWYEASDSKSAVELRQQVARSQEAESKSEGGHVHRFDKSECLDLIWHGWGFELFHTVHRNLGPGGSPPLKVWAMWVYLVDVEVDVGLSVVAEGRACRGQVKTQHVQTCLLTMHLQTSKIAPGKIVCGKVCTAWPTSPKPHQMLHIYISYWRTPFIHLAI
jgi:hypothetical protein